MMMMMMISMSLTVAPTPQGTGARALIFTNSWKRGGTRLHTRDLPLHQTEGLPSLRSPEPTPSPRGRAPDSGSGTTGHGGVSPLLQIAGHVGQQETRQSVLPASKALAKMTNCTRRAINLDNFLYNNKSGTLVAVG